MIIYIVFITVAILILLELTLQSIFSPCMCSGWYSRNPYFIGINSAMQLGQNHGTHGTTVAILILLELTLQFGMY